MLLFGFVGEKRAELNQSFLDDGRELDDRRHGRILHHKFELPKFSSLSFSPKHLGVVANGGKLPI
jgi:hypothetical protein